MVIFFNGPNYSVIKVVCKANAFGEIQELTVIVTAAVHRGFSCQLLTLAYAKK